MIFWLLILLNSTFSNNFEISGDFYQLPNYSENSYREVFALNIQDSLDVDYDYFVLKTYFNIYEPVGFDSLEDNSYGMRNTNLQAIQFQFDMKLNFMDLSIGRVLNFEEYDFYSVDGFRAKFSFKNFSFSLLHGKEVNTDSFLGRTDFYDEKSREITDYYVSSLSVSAFYDINNSIGLKFIEYKNNGYLEYQAMRASIDINFWKISSTSTMNYLISRGDFEQVLLNFELYGAGIEYEEYKPFFFNDSIFNLFVIEKYKRSSVFYNYKIFDVSLFTENFEYYGAKFVLKLFKNYKLSSEYLHKEHFSLYLSSKFDLFASDYMDLILNYFHQEEIDSLALRTGYTHKLILQSNVKLYTDFIYNNYYKFQLRAGFMLTSEF